ncbi:MAG: hypothetical protein ACMXYL_02485 [Candidatus Woesearchaeota archaeon]
MASIVEGVSGLIGGFLPFFMVLFTWVIVFAFLDKTKVFGDSAGSKGRNSIIALVVALMVLATPDITRLITVVVPWFFFLFLFFMLVAIGFYFVGGKEEHMFSALSESQGVWVFIVIGGIIVAMAAGSVYGDQLLDFTTDPSEPTNGNATGPPSSDTGSFRDNLGAVLFDPAVLGLIAFMLIATFAILFLGQDGVPK